jgi:hypothetical protein
MKRVHERVLAHGDAAAHPEWQAPPAADAA